MGNSTGGFVFDTRCDPLHLQVIPSEFTREELQAHFDEIDAFYPAYVARRSRAHIGLLADARDSPYIDARDRQRIAATFAMLGPLLGSERSVAHAVITNNALTRGALTAILWLQSPPWEIRVFTSMHEGEAWLRSTFDARGLGQPDAPREWWLRAQ